MFDKLESVVNRHEQIGIELTRPDVASDNELFRKLMKEYSELTPLVEKYKEYVAAKNAEKEALEILAEPNLDKDFKELAEEELKEAKENITLLVVKLKKMKQMMRLHIENYSKKQELAKLILN